MGKQYWKYTLLKVKGGYSVCEAYYDGKNPKHGHSEAIIPFGETKDDLINCLQMIINDIEADKKTVMKDEDV